MSKKFLIEQLSERRGVPKEYYNGVPKQDLEYLFYKDQELENVTSDESSDDEKVLNESNSEKKYNQEENLSDLSATSLSDLSATSLSDLSATSLSDLSYKDVSKKVKVYKECKPHQRRANGHCVNIDCEKGEIRDSKTKECRKKKSRSKSPKKVKVYKECKPHQRRANGRCVNIDCEKGEIRDSKTKECRKKKSRSKSPKSRKPTQTF